MRELGWSAMKARGLTQAGYRDQVRVYCREVKTRRSRSSRAHCGASASVATTIQERIGAVPSTGWTPILSQKAIGERTIFRTSLAKTDFNGKCRKYRTWAGAADLRSDGQRLRDVNNL